MHVRASGLLHGMRTIIRSILALQLAATATRVAADGPATAPVAPTPSASVHADAVVAADGSGQYTTVRAAIDASPQIVRDDGRRWTILVRPGTYRELLYVQREKRFTAIVGTDARNTVITYDLSSGLPGADGKPIGTYRTPTVEVDADDFTISNLTIENTAGRRGPALALRINGDRVAVRHCRLTGFQDTLLVDRGRHYFTDCYIAGATDFIFGGATDWFDHCTIFATANGYLTAASTPDFQPFGYVFDHCTIDAAAGVKTFLGRPWRDYAKVAYLHTDMSAAVRPEGWDNWKKPDAERLATYAEYDGTGPGAPAGKRAPWSRQLTDAGAAAYKLESVLGGSDGWNPAGAPR
jgi:pectinesterase